MSWRTERVHTAIYSARESLRDELEDCCREIMEIEDEMEREIYTREGAHARLKDEEAALRQAQSRLNEAMEGLY